MTVASVTSIAIMIIVVIISAILILSPFFLIWYWWTGRRLRKQAEEYLKSQQYSKDLDELKSGSNYIEKEVRQNDRNEKEDSGNKSGSPTDRGYIKSISGVRPRQDERRVDDPSTVGRPSDNNTDRNKRRITLT